MAATPTSFIGSCLCRTVQFTLNSAPSKRYLCPCSSCRKCSGSSFMHNWNVAEDVLIYTTGTQSIRTWEDKTTESGTPVVHSFCSVCGSTLALRTKLQPERVILPSGLLDGEHVQSLVPEVENFVHERAEWIGFVAEK